jgi:hypothetical protein
MDERSDGTHMEEGVWIQMRREGRVNVVLTLSVAQLGAAVEGANFYGRNLRGVRASSRC